MTESPDERRIHASVKIKVEISHFAQSDKTMNVENREDTGSTCFATAERARKETLDFQKSGASNPLLQALLCSVDGYIAVLNEHRQVLICNDQLLVDLGLSSDDVLGVRPGEILKCKNSKTAPSGCGTSDACRQCGAVNAIIACQEESEAVRECIIGVDKDGVQDTLEFRAKATKLDIGPHSFVVLTLQNIAAEKRRAVLERTFFHDILNTVGGISGWSSLLCEFEKVPVEEAAERILRLSTQLIDEIKSQRDILAAERELLQPSYSKVSVADLFESINTLFKDNATFADRNLECQNVPSDIHLQTDKTLLTRVLCNMVKNALEASEANENVTVTYSSQDRTHRFEVHNEGEIPTHIAQQIFKRSFSTKGETGRGIGTYSMKLLGERHLNGKVGFNTSLVEGTTFYFDLPIN